MDILDILFRVGLPVVVFGLLILVFLRRDKNKIKPGMILQYRHDLPPTLAGLQPGQQYVVASAHKGNLRIAGYDGSYGQELFIKA
jgi:hypothetical protein